MLIQNLYSGLLAGKIVDACFEDILTQDPFKVVHEQRRAEAARYIYETSKLAESRSMLSNKNVIPKEPRRVTLVH